MTVPHQHRITPRMARNGERLHRDGKVHFLPHARTYTVEGDTPGAVYKVTVDHDRVSCDCPANGACKHVQAVRIARREDEESAHVLQLSHERGAG
jgi:uncharacterized Zn finger protein